MDCTGRLVRGVTLGLVAVRVLGVVRAAGLLGGSASCVTLTVFSFLGTDLAFSSGIGISKNKPCSVKEINSIGRIKACKRFGESFRL
jgi:hypothetical protein